MSRNRSVKLYDYDGHPVSHPEFEAFLRRTGLGLLTRIKLARLRKKKANDVDKEFTERLKQSWPESVRKAIVGNGRTRYTGDMRASLTTQVVDPIGLIKTLGDDAATVIEGMQLPIAWILADPRILPLLYEFMQVHVPGAKIQIEDFSLVLNAENFKLWLESHPDFPDGLVETKPKSRSLFIEKS